MSADSTGPSGNRFETNKSGTAARTKAEGLIEQLRNKGGLFVEAVRATRMPMAVSDPSLPGNPIVFCNEAFLNLSGYSMDEVLGQQPHFMNGEETDPDDAVRFRQALAEDRDEVIETIQYRKDHSRFVASVFLSAFKDADGRTLFQFLSYLDITARVAAENELLTRAKLEAHLREREAQLRAVLEGIGEAFYVLDRDWRFVFASQSALTMWGKRADDIVGRPFLDCFPITAGSEVFEAHRRVMQLGAPEKFETRSPILERWLEVEITQSKLGGIAVSFRDIDARKLAEIELRESEQRHRAILEGALDYAIFTMDAQGIINSWPPGAQAVFGWSAKEAIGQPFAMTFVPEDRAANAPEKELVQAQDEGWAPNVRWHLRKGGERIFINGSTRPMREGDILTGFIKVGQDVTRARQLGERQQILLAELQHRTRNLMGVVSSMFEKTRRSSTSVEDLALTYRDRLQALARVQGVLSRLTDGKRVTFDELIRTELVAMGAIDAGGKGRQVELEGPDGILLRSATLQTLALALHELATNAVKYGALAQPNGRLSIQWRLIRGPDEVRLRIEWIESGVEIPPSSAQTQRSGYGRELIERALPYQLDAQTSYKLGPNGVQCSIELPVSTIMERAQG